MFRYVFWKNISALQAFTTIYPSIHFITISAADLIVIHLIAFREYYVFKELIVIKNLTHTNT